MRTYSTFERPQQKRSGHLGRYFSKQNTKSLILVLVWTILVGFINCSVNSSPSFVVSRLSHNKEKILLYTELCLFIVLAIAMTCYPLGGLLADVYFGRYKIIKTSLITMTVSMFVVSVVLFTTLQIGVWEKSHILVKTALFVGGGGAFLILAIGLAGFTSNIVQFGLDQLQDAPSNKLGAFVHTYVWASRVGYAAFETIYAIKFCYFRASYHPLMLKVLVYTLPEGCFIALSALLLLNCFTHRMFNKERVNYNPYKMIFRILNFARKHKRAVGHPSAFAYCDTFKPSRMDYAKERYGGPFTTPDVEDVKTFIRVFLMLIALGPAFVTVVPSSYYLFATFAIHTGTHNEIGNGKCSAEWALLQSGLLSEIVSTLIMPLYTWLLFSVLYRKNLLPICYLAFLFNSSQHAGC